MFEGEILILIRSYKIFTGGFQGFYTVRQDRNNSGAPSPTLINQRLKVILEGLLDHPERLDAIVVELGLLISEGAKINTIVKKTSSDMLGCLTRLYHNQAAGLQHLKQFQRYQRSSKRLGQTVMDSFCSSTKYDRIVASMEDICKQYLEKYIASTDVNIEFASPPRLILDFSPCKFSATGDYC